METSTFTSFSVTKIGIPFQQIRQQAKIKSFVHDNTISKGWKQNIKPNFSYLFTLSPERKSRVECGDERVRRGEAAVRWLCLEDMCVGMGSSAGPSFLCHSICVTNVQSRFFSLHNQRR